MKVCARPCQRLTDQIKALVSYVLSRVLCPEKSTATNGKSTGTTSNKAAAHFHRINND